MPHVSAAAVPTADSWPIAAAMLAFPAVGPGGEAVQDGGRDLWLAHLTEVARTGFDHVDLTDSWLRVGDLNEAGISDLRAALDGAGLTAAAISAIRRSVIDPEAGEENLAYSHRTLDAAAALGIDIVSIGFHRPLTPEQRRATWFWTVQGPRDPRDDETYALAVTRLGELARHAEGLDLQLSLEMYEDTLLGDAASAVRLVEMVGSSALGLNPDLGNLYRLHRPVEPFLEALATCLPHANYWHVKSYTRLEDDTTGVVLTAPAPMESGTMNYREAIRMALSSGYTAPFCVEHYGGDGLAVSARNREYLRTLLDSQLAVPAPR